MIFKNLLDLLKAVFIYGMVGGFCAILDIITIYFFVDRFKFEWFWVTFSSYIIFTYLNYLLSIKFIFSSEIRFEKRTEILMVFLFSGIGLILNQIIIYFLHEFHNIYIIFAKIVAIILIFTWNFSIRYFYVFDRKN